MQTDCMESENKNEQTVWEEYRNFAWACRERTGKAKIQLELRCIRDVNSNKRVFHSMLAMRGILRKMWTFC